MASNPKQVEELGRFRLPMSVAGTVKLLDAFAGERPEATIRTRGPVVIIEAPLPTLLTDPGPTTAAAEK